MLKEEREKRVNALSQITEAVFMLKYYMKNTK